MKEWPKDDKPAQFSDLADEIVKAIRFAYTCKRKNRGKSIKLVGPDAPANVGCPEGSATLSAETLAYSEENQGRDALEEIVGVAIRLGIEQGRRITMNSHDMQSTRTSLDAIGQMVEHLRKKLT